MIRTSGRPVSRRRALTLTESLVVLAVFALAASIGIISWIRTNEAATLRQAQMQVAATLRDAIAKTEQSNTGGTPLVVGGVTAQVVFTPGSGTLSEQVATNGGSWQTVTPPGGSSTLPAGVTVQSTTWTNNTMVVNAGDTSTGTYQAFHTTLAGQVILVTTDGMTATVQANGAGNVWY